MSESRKIGISQSKFIFGLLLICLFFGCNSNVNKEGLKVEINEKKVEPINWSSKVTYEIFIQSFADSNNDGIGDFIGATSKLDYLQELGVEAVWLMPIMESPSYHKYDVTNYKSVHPDYGTFDDFRTFVSEAHKRGISVIIDLIINHTSNSHPWFLESKKGKENPYRNYYVWKKEEDIKGDIAKRTISHDSDNITQWHESVNNEELYYGFFHGGMPDLNYDNPKVLEEIFDIGAFWLNEMDVDGFRMDAAKHIFRNHRAKDNHEFWKEFRNGMEAIKPDVYIVGEVWADAKTAAPYSEGLSVLFNFDLAHSILETVKNGKVSSATIADDRKEAMENVSSIQALIDNKNTFLDVNPDFTDGVFLANHDQNRAMTVLDDNIKKAKLAAFIYLTLPGQPYIYYGEEIGMKGQKPDEFIREPMLWESREKDSLRTSWIQPQYSTEQHVVPVAQQMSDSSSLLNFYKSLLRLRKDSEALSVGSLDEVSLENSRILSYKRIGENQSLVILHNVSQDNILLKLPEEIAAYKKVLFALGNPKIVANQIELPALSSVILSSQ